MNENLEKLRIALPDGVTTATLIDALYVLRAPQSLTAIIPMARQFRDWRRKYCELNQLSNLPTYEKCLAILDQIADLTVGDENLTGREVGRYQSKWTPLRPLTGDSVAGELLLVQAGGGVDRSDFERASVWLLWQAQRFHIRNVTRSAYEQYLVTKGARLLQMGTGSRLYGAYLALRRLAKPDAKNRDRFSRLVSLMGELSADHSLELTLLARLVRLAHGSRDRPSLEHYASAVLGYEKHQLDAFVKRTCTLLPAELALLLVTIWGGELRERCTSSRGHGRAMGITIVRPQIRHGPRLLEILRRTDDNGIHAGTVADFFERHPKQSVRSSMRSVSDDDPVDDEHQDPAFSIFLADRSDLISGYYASNGLRNAIEYDHAQIRWNKWTLSRTEIDAVGRLVTCEGRDMRELEPIERSARLAIGLSLLTGRSLEEMATPLIADNRVVVDSKTPVAVSLAQNCLHVFAGQPNLREVPKQKLPMCHRRGGVIVLPLPESWKLILCGMEQPNRRSRSAIAKAARGLLLGLNGQESAWHITEKGVRYALVRALAEYTRGDLGVQAVITGGTEANQRNIIHYASYPANQVQAWWHKAAEALVGPLCDAGQLAESVGYVGSQHAFEVDQLAAHFAEIKKRLRIAEAEEDWIRAYNLLTLYLSYWLGLGLAERRTLTPVPRIVLEDNWVLLTDKHRRDGSTDRMTVMTDTLRSQLAAYVALADELSITLPALNPLAISEQGVEIQLQYIRRLKDGKGRGRQREVVPYQPKWQEQHETLVSIPGNWGRKVLRSESIGLPGRVRDAQLGHFVRGRHAWEVMSTLNARRFRARTLELQESLEQRLGFEVLVVAECATTRRHWGPVPMKPCRDLGKSRAPPREIPTNEIEIMLRNADARCFSALDAKNQGYVRERALDWVRRVVDAEGSSSIDHLKGVADAACTVLRERLQIPIFCKKRTTLPRHKIVLNSGGIQTLGYLQRHVMPLFFRDLERLPAKVSHLAGNAASVQRKVELGRLAMLAIWRLGLAHWRLIDAWFHALFLNAPILAQGVNRYMIFQTSSEASKDSMSRTVFLDSFTSAYLAIERRAIKRDLLVHLFRRPSSARRRVGVDSAINAYLRHLGAEGLKVSLTAMMEAATQSIMLQSTPLVAAYASGAIVTTDLGDRELRRLAGLEPGRRSGIGAKDSIFGPKAGQLDDADIQLAYANQGLPTEESFDLVRTAFVSYWREEFARRKGSTPLHTLLWRFAGWLVDHPDDEKQTYRRLNSRRVGHIVARVKVVAYAILGFTSEAHERWIINGETLAMLQELTRDEFPDRLQHGAWFHFHRFLADENADHAGFEINALGPMPGRAVAAKMLSADEYCLFHSQLRSPISGVGNAVLRISAQRHIELMAAYGMRRSESTHLRSVDYQQDICRVQAYGPYTLKTAWSDRRLPIGFAPASTQSWLRDAKVLGLEKLIDPDTETSVAPDNFFHSVSLALKAVTDESMGSHHLRHTFISAMLLTLHRKSTGLEELYEDLPWLEGLMVSKERIDLLLGSEGDAGQGLRAVSALVGHAHPSTTLRHYVHVMCIALHGTMRKADTLDMSRSFEGRIGGTSTVQRWATQARVGVTEIESYDQRRQTINRMLRDRIERRFRWDGVDRDETARDETGYHVRPAVVGQSTEAIRFDTLELVDRSLRDGYNLVEDAEIEIYRHGLTTLANIATGKRGSTVPRHALQEVGKGVWMPRRLAAGTATQAASGLCDWLESLKVNQPEEFEWLVQRWTFASERERGRMRLDDSHEAARAMQLSDSQRVVVSIERAAVSNSRGRKTTGSTRRMRLKCIGPDGAPVRRDTQAVRWVMSYVAAKWLVSNYPEGQIT